jgi:hypothetical protein
MSNRKPATAAKRAHTSKKVAQKAQRAAQAVVRSSIARRAPAADSTRSAPEPQSDAGRETHLVDSPAMVLQDDSKQTMTAAEPKSEPGFPSAVASAGAYEAHPVDNPAMVLQDGSKQTMTATEPKREPGFPSAMASAGAYQAKLLEMAQADMKLALEFAQRLAWMRSPFEFPSVITEFTTKRIDMFRKHSKEMAELTIKR